MPIDDDLQERRNDYDVTNTVQVSSPTKVRAAVKDLFAARWEPRHLVYAGGAVLARIAVAVVDVHTTLHERSPLPRLIAAARALRGRAARGVRG